MYVENEQNKIVKKTGRFTVLNKRPDYYSYFKEKDFLVELSNEDKDGYFKWCQSDELVEYESFE
jgi:hypothetical protein